MPQPSLQNGIGIEVSADRITAVVAEAESITRIPLFQQPGLVGEGHGVISALATLTDRNQIIPFKSDNSDFAGPIRWVESISSPVPLVRRSDSAFTARDIATEMLRYTMNCIETHCGTGQRQRIVLAVPLEQALSARARNVWMTAASQAGVSLISLIPDALAYLFRWQSLTSEAGGRGILFIRATEAALTCSLWMQNPQQNWLPVASPVVWPLLGLRNLTARQNHASDEAAASRPGQSNENDSAARRSLPELSAGDIAAVKGKITRICHSVQIEVPDLAGILCGGIGIIARQIKSSCGDFGIPVRCDSVPELTGAIGAALLAPCTTVPWPPDTESTVNSKRASRSFSEEAASGPLTKKEAASALRFNSRHAVGCRLTAKAVGGDPALYVVSDVRSASRLEANLKRDIISGVADGLRNGRNIRVRWNRSRCDFNLLPSLAERLTNLLTATLRGVPNAYGWPREIRMPDHGTLTVRLKKRVVQLEQVLPAAIREEFMMELLQLNNDHGGLRIGVTSKCRATIQADLLPLSWSDAELVELAEEFLYEVAAVAERLKTDQLIVRESVLL